MSAEQLIGSPYLVSAIYYHDGIFDDFRDDKTDADPADRIVSQIARVFSQQTKRTAVELFVGSAAPSFSELSSCPLVPPVPYETPFGNSRNVHRYAIDLFTEEGTPVLSAARGLVVLAESGWISGDWFSTSTVRGGNTVIVFDPDKLRFFRYAHLDHATVAPGMFVEAGEVIGAVGHTGFNASRKGHGHHLHWEINEFQSGVTVPLGHDDLQILLEAASAKSPGYALLTNLQTDPG